MTKKQIANSKRRTLKRAKKSIDDARPSRFRNSIASLPRRDAPSIASSTWSSHGRRIILEAFKRVPAKDREVELPGYDIPPGESGPQG